jgi:trk system potassium uptake protein TrkH
LIDIRPVLLIDGFLLLILAAFMAVPVIVDLSTDGSEWPAFLISLSLATFVGLAMIFVGSGERRRRLRKRRMFLAVVIGILLCSIFAALPFELGGLRLSVTDGLFESISGLTTTGSTVITGLDSAPRSVLVWRALLNWLGGLGIVLGAVTALPQLGFGGSRKPIPDSMDSRVDASFILSRLNKGIIGVYLALTIALAIGFGLCGMSPLESVCHAMSTLSTGGFSTSDQSLGHFGSGARWVAICGMIVGGGTFSLYTSPWKRNSWSILRDSQLRWYLGVLVLFALMLAFWTWLAHDVEPMEALRRSLFNAVAVITTTGFHTEDYDAWGGFSEVAFFVMAFIGGCTGSTSGGIKIFRFQILLAMAATHIKRLLHPNGVFTVEINRATISDTIVRSVLGFVMLYFSSAAALTLALSLTGLNTITSLTGAVAALSNLGPGLGHIIGPGGSYRDIPDAAKWLLDLGMLTGRIEIAPILILFSSAFWKP